MQRLHVNQVCIKFLHHYRVLELLGIGVQTTVVIKIVEYLEHRYAFVVFCIINFLNFDLKNREWLRSILGLQPVEAVEAVLISVDHKAIQNNRDYRDYPLAHHIHDASQLVQFKGRNRNKQRKHNDAGDHAHDKAE